MSVIVSTLIATIKSIATVLVVYLTGFFMVKLKKIDETGVKYLVNLSNWLFIPALFVIRLGSGLNLTLFKYAWKVSVFAFLILVVNVLIGMALVPIAKPPLHFKRMFLLGLSVSNTVALPLVLITSLCSQVAIEKPDFFLQDLDIANVTEDEVIFFSEAECREVGELYIFLYTILVTLIVFTFGWEFVENDHNKIRESVSDTSDNHEDSPLEDKAMEGEQAHMTTEHKSSFLDVLSKLQISLSRPINSSQFVGLLIGLVSPIQNIFFSQDAVLSPISGGIEIIAAGATSLINLIMACTLSIKLCSFDSLSDFFNFNEEKIGISRRSLLVYVIGRMIIVPGVLLLFVWQILNIKSDKFEILPDDQLMKLIIYLQLITPSANMVIVLAQIVDQKKNAEILAFGLLVQYFVAVFSVTAYTFAIFIILDLQV